MQYREFIQVCGRYALRLLKNSLKARRGVSRMNFRTGRLWVTCPGERNKRAPPYGAVFFLIRS